MILAPIMVVGLYDVSRRLEAGLPVSLRDCFRAFGRSVGQLSVLGVVLMVAYLFWVMTALLLFMLFFNQSPPQFDQFFQDVVLSPPGIALLLFGGAIGAVFAWVAFAVTAVSIPLIYDRPVDVRLGSADCRCHRGRHRHRLYRACRGLAGGGVRDLACLSGSHRRRPGLSGRRRLTAGLPEWWR